jgi:hypothetical protein
MNNGKYDTESYKAGQAAKIDRLWGEMKAHSKVCECCSKKFVIVGREKTKVITNAKFCSRGCANNRSGWWKDNATGYRTIASQHHEMKCVVCGFDKIIAVHHIDENKKNNHPTNLIPLCPNHHEMVHSKWKNEVLPIIQEWQRGIGIVGNTVALQASVSGSTPLSSTKDYVKRRKALLSSNA